MNTIVIDTAAEIARFRLCSLRGALRLEQEGMKKRGASALAIAKKMGYVGNRKAIIATITAELKK